MLSYLQIKQALDFYDLKKPWYRRIFGDQSDIKKLRKLFNDLTPIEYKSVDYELSERESVELASIINSRTTVEGSASHQTFENLVLNPEYQNKNERNLALPSDKLSKSKSNKIYDRIAETLAYYDQTKSIFARLFGDSKEIQRLRKRFVMLDRDQITRDQQYELSRIVTFSKEKSEIGWTGLKDERFSDGLHLNCGNYLDLGSSSPTSDVDTVKFDLDQSCFYHDYAKKVMGNNLSKGMYDKFKQNNFLEPKYCDAVFQGFGSLESTKNRFELLLKLRENNVLDDECVKEFKSAYHLFGLDDAFKVLESSQVPKEFWRLVLHEMIHVHDRHKHDDHFWGLSYITRRLVELRQQGYINHSNEKIILDKVKDFDRFSELWDVFCAFGGRLREDERNLDAVIDCCNAGPISQTKHIMSRIGQPNQQAFDNLIRFRWVWESHQVSHALIQLPDHLFTRDLFGQLIQRCEQHLRDRNIVNIGELDDENDIRLIRSIRTLVQNTLNTDPNQVAEAAVDINPGQSTHEVSVHESVSDSAKTLRANYGAAMDSDKKRKAILKQMSEFFDQLPDSSDPMNREAAAKRAFKRILGGDYAKFVDRRSDVSTQEVMLLTWLAIHDRSRCLATLEDALVFYVEGFFECQRGYNLKKGVDQGGQDKPICIPGTFNKIVQSLWGIHPDVDLKFITKGTASVKAHAVIAECAENYLSKISENDRAKLMQLWDKKAPSESDDVNVSYRVSEIIWEAINDEVTNIMRDMGYEAAYMQKEGLYAMLSAMGTAALETGAGEDVPLEKLFKPYREVKVKVTDHSIFKSPDEADALKGESNNPNRPPPPGSLSSS